MARITRRRFLTRSASAVTATAAATTFGGGLSAVLLGGCGEQLRAPDVAALFNPDRVLAAGRPQRIPFALINPGGEGGVALPSTDDALVTVELIRDGEILDRIEVAGHVVSHDHVGEVGDHQHSDLYRYYPARFTMPEPGIYDLMISVDSGFGNPTSTSLPVQAFDPADITVPLPGDPMPAVATPTFADPAGVDRLCTRPDPCPFHEDSFDTLMTNGRPSALLVATPAFCSTAYCGPVVDTMIEASAAVDGVDIVHAEVYANTDEVDGNFADPAIRLAPAVIAARLTFEPVLFLVSSDGVLVDRIDNVFDVDEAIDALSALA
ncbi:MAG: hypothetical protein OEW83_04935 [Acidimicrobiia bacterium]|nr:hypothetical protein [Acidimicrobiia bacterium]